MHHEEDIQSYPEQNAVDNKKKQIDLHHLAGMRVI